MSFILLGILNSQATAAAGGPSYDLLSTTILTSTASSVTFSSIDSSYKHLQLRVSARDTYASLSVNAGLMLTFNSDSGSNYAGHKLQGNGSSLSASAETSYTFIRIHDCVPTGGNNSNVFGAAVIDILDYVNTNKYKTARYNSGGFSANEKSMVAGSGLWQSTSAITSITVADDNDTFAIGSRFSLYGIKG